jgi:hypothetical protein
LFVDKLHSEDPAMVRWERQEDGGWQGFSGELLVATVTKDESAEREQWLWSITALKRPKGWRKGAGHRTSWIDARRAAEEYWAKWVEQAALRADVMQLASRSLAKERKPGSAGIVSKRVESRYRSGRCATGRKVKNPA